MDKNIKKSFSLVKTDIVQLQNKVIELSKVQRKLLESIEELANRLEKPKKAPAKKTKKK